MNLKLLDGDTESEVRDDYVRVGSFVHDEDVIGLEIIVDKALLVYVPSTGKLRGGRRRYNDTCPKTVKYLYSHAAGLGFRYLKHMRKKAE